MPPQSRGNPLPTGLFSKSTPNLPTLRSFEPSPPPPPPLPPHPDAPPEAGPTRASTDSWTSPPSEPASIDSFPSSSSSSSASASDSDTTPLSNPPLRRPPQQSRSTTYLGPAAFAPPFYNRPPTPLPPSPSLTSLLRPAFNSAHPSPDHSSDDASAAGNTNKYAARDASTAVSTLTSSFRTARPVARASPKVPTYEYYGFTLYLSSSAVFTFYLLWAFLPSPFLHQLGIHYYPNRWWALAVPAWLVMAVVWCYVALAGWNTERETLGLGDVRTVVDEAAQVAVEGRGRRDTVTRRRTEMEGKGQWRRVWDEGTDAVMDIPVGGVCEVLYGEGRDRDQDDI